MSFTKINVNKQCFEKIPLKPGVYRFYNQEDDIIYVGASSSLRRRIRQHFMKSNNGNKKKNAIRRLTKYLEYRCYETVVTAFEAERMEIWRHKPRYNSRGRNVNSYSYLVVRTSPFLQVICHPEADYEKIKVTDEFYRINLSLSRLQQYLRLIRKRIPFCIRSSSSVCWDQHLRLCYNSCRNFTEISKYQSQFQVNRLIQAFSGANNSLITEFKKDLAMYVETLQFEAAKRTYNALNSIKEIEIKFCGKEPKKDSY